MPCHLPTVGKAAFPAAFSPDRSPEFDGRGPELFPGFGSLTLSGTTPPTQDANGLYFAAASNLAEGHANVTLKDSTTYEVVFTVAGYTGGAVRVLVYGATSAHLGATASMSANGTFIAQVTTNAAGSFTNQIRIQATGTSGTNTFNVTSVSVKEVL